MADTKQKDKETQERRQSERFSTWLNTSFQAKGQQWQQGFVRDISKSGMQIITLEPLRTGDHTTIVLENIRENENVLVAGKVIWKIHESPEGRNDWVAPSMGIEFDHSLPVDTMCFVH
ncbi:PilZ domain-containing protein [candidate division KSB1 bacterium]|nr:PilZ domain-containing protein [candidate division KSB1 bacterium]